MVEIGFLCIVAIGAVLGLRIPFEQPRTGLILAVGALLAVAIAVALHTPPEPHIGGGLGLALQLDMAMPVAAVIASYAAVWVAIGSVQLVRGHHEAPTTSENGAIANPPRVKP
jgi:hypothetical protein